ncbi:nucleotide exchange factor GrpE [Patescibacteria group bacterium]|nr:nucleotide exchange factor GrpE [Patescibacteria group bacterium]
MNKESSKNPPKKKFDPKIDKVDKRAYSTDEDLDILDQDVEIESNEAIAKLKKKLKECQQEKKEFLDGWQRSKAELINARKQDTEHNKQTLSRLEENFIYQLLPVLDSFDMAFADTKALEKVDSNWKNGVQNIHSQFKTFLKDLGVHSIDQTNVPFDPNKHDCIETVLTTKKEQDDLIFEVLQKGYMLNDTVIRAARVRIFKFKP